MKQIIQSPLLAAMTIISAISFIVAGCSATTPYHRSLLDPNVSISPGSTNVVTNGNTITTNVTPPSIGGRPLSDFRSTNSDGTVSVDTNGLLAALDKASKAEQILHTTETIVQQLPPTPWTEQWQPLVVIGLSLASGVFSSMRHSRTQTKVSQLAALIDPQHADKVTQIVS